MPRYIDANLLKAEFTGNFAKAYATPLIKAIIDGQPTADVQEIKHGHWNEENARQYSTKWICSECREISYTAQHRGAEKQCTLNYCPHCGAKMDGKAE